MPSPTVQDLVALWLSQSPSGIAGGRPVCARWRRTRVSLARHLATAIGLLEVDGLGPAHVWHVQAWGRNAGLAAETINKITHHVLPAMLRDFEVAGFIPAGTRERAMSGAARLRPEGESAWTALSLHERDAAIMAFRGHWAAPLVSFLFFTGVRIGEACGLRQRDIDWHRKTCRIMRSRRYDEVSATKSRRSQRTLQLSHAALAAITTLRRDDEPDAYLFLGWRGNPLNADSFRVRTWAPTLRRAGLKPIRIHDTRHTFATLALEAGIPVAKVAAYLGDKIQTVEARYAHVLAIDDWDRAVSAPRLRSAR